MSWHDRTRICAVSTGSFSARDCMMDTLQRNFGTTLKRYKCHGIVRNSSASKQGSNSSVGSSRRITSTAHAMVLSALRDLRHSICTYIRSRPRKAARLQSGVSQWPCQFADVSYSMLVYVCCVTLMLIVLLLSNYLIAWGINVIVSYMYKFGFVRSKRFRLSCYDAVFYN